MNNPFLLACEVAEFRLRDEWNMAALQRAFGEEVDQVMANTWRLLRRHDQPGIGGAVCAL